MEISIHGQSGSNERATFIPHPSMIELFEQEIVEISVSHDSEEKRNEFLGIEINASLAISIIAFSISLRSCPSSFSELCIPDPPTLP
jgi:hypothetical protein